MLSELQQMWNRLGNISIDGNECIKEPFEHFPVGTPKEDIWHWIENTFNVSIYELMFGEAFREESNNA